MKLQFSLATLLVCLTVLTVDFALATAIPVKDTVIICFTPDANPRPGDDKQTIVRPPEEGEIISRLVVFVPLSAAVGTGTLRTIRRLKSRRHTEPPVG